MTGHTYRFIGAVAVCCFSGAASARAASDPYEPSELESAKASFPESEASVKAGGALYASYCAGCHGDEGEGDGGAAPYLDPRPRDFSKGLFKFRSTKSGELPTDADLYRIISRGIPGTAMPAWGEGARQLTEQERWQLTYYVKVLGGEDFTDPDFSPYEELLDYPEAPGETAERIARGKEIFSDEKKGGCIKCHGLNGRGNGTEAGTQRDDWGDDILPADMTKGWRYRNGTSVREIYRTFSTGVNGTPMPGYGETLNDEERWALAYFVESLIQEQDLSGEQVLVVRRTENLPTDPNDEAWSQTTGFAVPLLGQLVRRPRHVNPAVDQVTVRALHDGERIAVHLSWNDRTPSLAADDVDPKAVQQIDDTYIPAATLWQRRRLKFPDSLQLQFSSSTRNDGSLPFFYLGGGAGPVALWRWFADREAAGDKQAFEERLQNGAAKSAEPRAEAEQALSGKSHYDDGRWSLVLTRKMKLDGERKRDVTLAPGTLVPFSLQVWDGGNGEEGPLCSIASWQWMQIEAPTPTAAYVSAAIGFGGTQLLTLVLVWLARRSARSRLGSEKSDAARGAAAGS